MASTIRTTSRIYFALQALSERVALTRRLSKITRRIMMTCCVARHALRFKTATNSLNTDQISFARPKRIIAWLSLIQH